MCSSDLEQVSKGWSRIGRHGRRAGRRLCAGFCVCFGRGGGRVFDELAHVAGQPPLAGQGQVDAVGVAHAGELAFQADAVGVAWRAVAQQLFGGQPERGGVQILYQHGVQAADALSVVIGAHQRQANPDEC